MAPAPKQAAVRSAERRRNVELKIYRDTIRTMGSICDIPLEVPLEAEILIPDYLPAVFKIVKTLVHRVVLQRQLQGGRLLVEGYFRVEVLYQGEDQNLCTVEQKIAFSKQQELRGMEENSLPASCRLDISGEVQYINCRAVSQRRLDLRGAYHLQVYAAGDFQQEVITALAENGVQQKNSSIPTLQLYTSREKQFTLEEPVAFEAQPEVVVHTQATVQLQEVRIVAGKAVVKGELRTTVIYREAQTAPLHRQEAALPFHQVLEMEAADEDCECQAQLEMIGCSIFSEPSQEEETRLSCTCLLTVRAWKAAQFIGVTDCFSTQQELDVEYGECSTDTLLETVSNTVEVQAEGKLPEDSLQILECFAECSAPELVVLENRTAIRGKATAHLICRNDLGEIDCYDKTCEYLLPKRYELPLEEITASLTAVCDGVRCLQNDAQAQAEITVRVQGFLCRRQHSRVVQGVRCVQPLEKNEEIALRVYYAQAGEEVFDIAKRYHASPEAISALAGIEGDVLQAPARLLIPQSW